MATWVTHFRIAEGVLAQGFVLDRGLFALGNIAPDSGDPNPTGAGFLPNKLGASGLPAEEKTVFTPPQSAKSAFRPALSS
jgi:hypothetical protein